MTCNRRSRTCVKPAWSVVVGRVSVTKNSDVARNLRRVVGGCIYWSGFVHYGFGGARVPQSPGGG